MRVTCQSEVGKIRRVYLRHASAAFVDDARIERDWKELAFLDRPNLELAQKEYEVFEKLLTQEGASIKYFPMDPALTLDSIYCRDAAIATDYGMILCRMGKAARTKEPEAEGKTFSIDGVRILGTIEAPGTIEGGDVAWLDPTTLAVGHTYRTNIEGIHQLKAMLNHYGIEVITVSLPHYKGPTDVFHLMSILSPVNHHQAVVYSPLMPIAFREELIRRSFELIEVPENEFESMGCNVLAIAPGVCIMAKGNPITRDRLIKAGCRVIEYDGAEISVKGGGGPTCLTRPIEREV